MAWERLERRLKHTWLARAWSSLTRWSYDWWYPVDVQSGGYGRRRQSRPALVTSAAVRAVRNSWLGNQLGELLFHLHDWWWPPIQEGDLRGAHYQYRRVSRPVLAYRKWNRWFRKTWVGREFGWLLDQVLDVVAVVRNAVIYEFAWYRLRRHLVRPRTIVALTLLLIAITAAERFGRPAYRAYLERQYAAQAGAFLSKGDLTRADLRARQALRLNQENPEATVVHAEIAQRMNSPYALYWRQRAAMFNPAISNRLALANTALRLEPFPFPIATAALQSLEREALDEPAYHAARGALAVKLGDLPSAQQHYAKAVELKGEDPVARMSLAVLQIQSQDADLVRDSRVTLELLKDEGKLGILPLRALVAESAAKRDYTRAELLSSQLITNTQASLADNIMHLSLLRTRPEADFASHLRRVQTNCLAHSALIGQLASWMTRAGLAKECRDWLDELKPELRNLPMLRLAYADCLVTQRQWEALQSTLEAERWGALDHVRLAMLSMALRAQGENTAARVPWARAAAIASAAPTALNTLAQMTANWGWEDETEQILWQAATRLKAQTWPLQSLQKMYLARKDTRNLWRITDLMVRRNPGDKAARNNLAMLSLLLDRDIEQAQKTALELHQADPANPTFSSTYALALHLQGRTADAIEVLRALDEKELEQPSVGAYYGVMLAASGNKDAARKYLEKSQQALLLPEELALVNAAQRR